MTCAFTIHSGSEELEPDIMSAMELRGAQTTEIGSVVTNTC